MANEEAYYIFDSTDEFLAWHGIDSGELQGAALVGQSPSSAGRFFDGALRFRNIAIPQGTVVSYAQVRVYTSEQGSSGNVKWKVYGIKETNTSAFGSNPFGRPQTTAVTTQSSGLPGVGAYAAADVTSQVNEILAQGGWASGNAMGFLMFDNTSDLNAYFGDALLGSQLIIRLAAEPNFFPTPQSIAAPTFPAPESYGMKWVNPALGVDVRVATEDQLLITTRKKENKIITQGDIACTANVEKNIAHGLGYAPSGLAYVESGGYRFKLNRDFLGNTDPVVGGAQGYFGFDSSNLDIIINQSKNVYYYVFIDPVNES